MATLTVDRRSGVIVGYNIQWCENRRRHTIYLSSRTYRRKTVEGFKDLVETLIYYRKNGTIVPDRAVANRLADIPAELQTKLAKVGLINVTKSRTCLELWNACLKHKTDVKPKSLDRAFGIDDEEVLCDGNRRGFCGGSGRRFGEFNFPCDSPCKIDQFRRSRTASDG